MLSRQSERHPDHGFVFLRDGERDEVRLTLDELHQRARAIAVQLQQLELAGERALLLFLPGLDFIAAFFGCLYAGVIAVPTYPPDPMRLDRTLPRLRAITANAEAKVVLTTAPLLAFANALLPQAPDLAALRWLPVDALDLASGALWRPPKVTVDHLAFLQYTSGSTGTPKGVKVSHGNLLHNSAGIFRFAAHDPESVIVSWVPSYHDMGLIGGILQVVYAGAHGVQMSPMDFLQKPARWLWAMSRHRGTTSPFPNFALDLCVRKMTDAHCAELDLSPWRMAFNGAEPVRPESLERFAARFRPYGYRPEAMFPGYGLAESTLLATGGFACAPEMRFTADRDALRRQRLVEVADDHPRAQRLVGAGKVVDGIEIVIVDAATARRCPPDRMGEIWIRGPSVGHGYWARPEETARTFGAHLEGTGEGPFLRTGDLGFLRGETLFIAARLKDVIIIRGENHYPHDLEHELERSLPQLRPGCIAAFSIDGDADEELVIVAEVDERRGPLDPEATTAAIGEVISRAFGLQVHGVALLRAGMLPKTSSGKLQRQPTRLAWLDEALDPLASWTRPAPAPAPEVVAEDALEGPAEPDAAAWSGTEAELSTWLRQRVAAELGAPVRAVGAHRPFAEYGLDSKALVGLSGELETFLGRRVSPTLLYDHPSIASLARYLVARPGAREAGAGGASAAANEPLAIVSMACRLPGGVEGPEDLWALLSEGRDAITDVPAARWDVGAHFDADPSAAGRTYSRWGGFVGEVSGLDAPFFGISPREAVSVDPQERLLLETSWEALERARIVPDALMGSRTGVYVGVCGNEYQSRAMADLEAIDAYSLLGTAHSTMVGRLSYWLGLRGPNLAVDTACSSSLVALHLACQALRARECDLALAGGVNLLLSPEGFVSLSRLRALSPTGRCRTFSEDADGYVRAEGCGVVVVKRLADAQRDGDPILAIVRGTAVNQDGRSNGLTAPSGPAQQAVLRQALADGGLDPASVSFVECHGTGTPLGDPIEVQALAAVYGEGRAAPLRIGSIKTNLGHAEGAAGVAGLMKVVLALGRRRLPASLHAERPNPLIPWGDLPVEVTREALDWEAPADLPRRAGVSSFGFSGTNAHVVLEEAPAPASALETARPAGQGPAAPLFVPVSARSDAALRAQAGRLRAWLADHPDARVDDLALSLATTRAAFPARLALTLPAGAGSAELRGALDAFARAGVVPRGSAHASAEEAPGRLAVLFSGQGSQRPGMGLALRGQPGLEAFTAALDAGAEACAPHLDAPLLEALADPDRVHRTAFTQPALFALEVALFRQWEAWGIRPDVLLGHSIGELAAAHVAGVLALADAAALVCGRGRLMEALAAPGGAMASLDATEAEVAPILPRGAVIAAINAPRQTVVSGDGAAVEAVIERIRGQGRRAARLHVSHAFHSPHMDGMLAEFEALAAGFTYRPPQIPVISDVTGRLADPEAGDLVTAAYWARHVREAVRFSEGVQAALERGVTTFLECGPDAVLCGMAGAQVADGAALLAALRRDRDERQTLTAAAAGLYASGQALDLRALLASTGAQPLALALPTYPFQRERHWIEARRAPRGPVDPRWPSRHIPGRYLALAGDRHVLEIQVGAPLQPELGDHRVQGRIIVAGAWQLAAVLTALQRLWPAEPLELEDVIFAAPLLLDPPEAVRGVVIELDPAGEGRYGFQIRTGDGETTLHCSGAVRRGGGIPTSPPPMPRPEGSVQVLFDAMEASPLDLGPRWRWFERLDLGGDEASLALGPPADTAGEGVPVPGPLLDAAMVATALVHGAVSDPPQLPFAVGRLRWTGAPLPRALLSVRADRVASTPEAPTADAVFFDPDGAPVLQLERLVLRRADLRAQAGARALMVLRSQPARLVDEGAVPGASAEASGVRAEASPDPSASAGTSPEVSGVRAGASAEASGAPAGASPDMSGAPAGASAEASGVGAVPGASGVRAGASSASPEALAGASPGVRAADPSGAPAWIVVDRPRTPRPAATASSTSAPATRRRPSSRAPGGAPAPGRPRRRAAPGSPHLRHHRRPGGGGGRGGLAGGRRPLGPAPGRPN
ncbi:MAG: beta-ketoacyl synthase N-terminal-like domain-containing protein [Nannocystaceae bacterium]